MVEVKRTGRLMVPEGLSTESRVQKKRTTITCMLKSLKNKCPNPFPGNNSQKAVFQKKPSARIKTLKLFAVFLWVESLDNAVGR